MYDILFPWGSLDFNRFDQYLVLELPVSSVLKICDLSSCGLHSCIHWYLRQRTFKNKESKCDVLKNLNGIFWYGNDNARITVDYYYSILCLKEYCFKNKWQLNFVFIRFVLVLLQQKSKTCHSQLKDVLYKKIIRCLPYLFVYFDQNLMHTPNKILLSERPRT